MGSGLSRRNTNVLSSGAVNGVRSGRAFCKLSPATLPANIHAEGEAVRLGGGMVFASRFALIERRDGQVITIEEADGVAELRVLLDDSMVDLDRPVKVVFEGRTLFEGTVSRSEATVVRTLEDRGDPRMVFNAEIPVSLSAPR